MTEDNLPARTVTTAELEAITEQDVDLFLAILAGEVTVAETDPGAISKEMLARTLNADSADAVLGEFGDTVGSDTLVGHILEVRDWSLRPSNIGDGGVWMLVDAIDTKDGEVIAMSTSARTIMAQLAKLKWMGELPILVKIKQSDKATASGYYPLSLVRALA